MVAEKYQHIKPYQFAADNEKEFKKGFYWGWLIALGWLTIIAIIL